jgi:hypothetical protein
MIRFVARMLLLVAFCANLAAAPASARHAAVEWANAHREAVFEQLFPAAGSSKVQMPVCRVTTIRSPGSIDTMEFAIRVSENCDTIDPRTNRRQPGEIDARLIIADGTPLTVQLATIHLSDPTADISAATARLKVKAISLSSKLAAELLKRIASTRMALLPPTDISLDARTYDVMSTTGVEFRFATLVSARGRNKAEAYLIDGIWRVLAPAGYRVDALRYDPTAWNQ